jgi:hypothetical protein
VRLDGDVSPRLIFSLGAKPQKLSNRQADFTAAIRTVWVTTHLVACGFIIASAGRNLALW